MTDGPYVETKEHLAGVYFIDASDMDEATAIAAGIPVSPRIGAVEIRPACGCWPLTGVNLGNV